jgi:hypothetical protein
VVKAPPLTLLRRENNGKLYNVLWVKNSDHFPAIQFKRYSLYPPPPKRPPCEMGTKGNGVLSSNHITPLFSPFPPSTHFYPLFSPFSSLSHLNGFRIFTIIPPPQSSIGYHLSPCYSPSTMRSYIVWG